MNEERLDDEFLKQLRQPPRAEFADALYRSLSGEPTNTTAPRSFLATLQELAPRRLALRLSAAALVALALLVASPTARAQLADLLRAIGGVTFVERAEYPAEVEPLLAQPSSEEAALWNQSVVPLEEAQGLLPFDLHLPAWTPEGFEPINDIMVALPREGSAGEGAFVLAIVTWCNVANGECLRLNIENGPGGANQWMVGAGSIEETRVNGRPAALVRGAWDSNVDAWAAGEVVTLSWQPEDSGVTYHLMASEGAAPLADLVHMAESIP